MAMMGGSCGRKNGQTSIWYRSRQCVVSLVRLRSLLALIFWPLAPSCWIHVTPCHILWKLMTPTITWPTDKVDKDKVDKDKDKVEFLVPSRGPFYNCVLVFCSLTHTGSKSLFPRQSSHWAMFCTIYGFLCSNIEGANNWHPQVYMNKFQFST